MERLRRWWALPGPERGQFLVLWMLMPVMSASLRLLGYRKTLGWVDAVARPPRRPRPPTIEEADRLARLAAIAGRHAAVEATCLRQALAVLLMLRRRGATPSLKLGVGRSGASPDMHAWVELDGRALGQSNPRHQPFHR